MRPLRSAVLALLAARLAAGAPLAAEPAKELAALAATIDGGKASAGDQRDYAERVFDLAGRDAAAAAPEFARTRAVLSELVAAEPRDARSWWLLGWFLEADAPNTDLAAARRLFEAGLAQAPEVATISEGLARVLLVQGEDDDARAVVEAALARSSAAPIERVRLELLRVDLDERAARALFRAGRGEEGERLLIARVAAEKIPEVRDTAANKLELYRRWQREAGIGERYQAAVDLINAQQIEPGAEALRQFLRDYPDSLQAEAARAALEQVEAFLARRRARQQQPAPPPPR